MQSMEQALIGFFEQVAGKDPGQLQKLQQEPGFSLEPARWCFTLPGLHAYLQQQDALFREVDYRQFRQLVFNSPINRSVKALGAEITITENSGKVDKSSYALVWRDT